MAIKRMCLALCGGKLLRRARPLLLLCLISCLIPASSILPPVSGGGATRFEVHSQHRLLDAGSLFELFAIAAGQAAVSGLDAASAASEVKIGYYDMAVVRNHCHELATAAKIKSDAEAELTFDFEASKRALANMRAQKLPANEVDAAASQIQAELNNKLRTLGARIKQTNNSVDRELAGILEAVRKENKLDLLVERSAVDTDSHLDLRSCKNVTDFVVTHLLSGDRVSSARMPSRSPSAFGSKRLNINECQGLFFGKSVCAESLQRLKSAGVIIDETKKQSELQAQAITVSFGNVLFVPGADLCVRSKNCEVVIPKGAVICILTNAYCTAIFDFHDNALGKRPRLVTCGKEISLSPGTELLVASKDCSSLESLNPDVKLGNYDVHVADLSDKGKMFVSKFSMMDGVTSMPMIQELLNSTDAAQKRAAYNVMKNAAILAN